MSTKLNEIKAMFNEQNTDGNLVIRLNVTSFKWLLKQAEKAEELEKRLKDEKE